MPFAKAAKHFAVLVHGKDGVLIALVDATKARIEAGLNVGYDHSDTVTLDKVQPVAIKSAPKGFDKTALMLMGGVARSLQIAGALEAMLDMSVRYSNERVAFEKKISKFQAVQHNLARLAGESAAALAAATSAADAIASAKSFDDEVYLEAASAKIRCAESCGKRRRHRASGVRRDRLHHGAYSAPLFAAGAGLARRFRLGEPLGRRAR
ncbi:alkylation response protein AidB-like acyl-CoA dehydrogenase [Bradyrhizobium sp. LM2.7]